MQFNFSIQTVRTTGVGKLAAMKPDKDGFYCGVPMTVLGIPSRNNMVYDPTSLVNAMTNPKSRFYQALRSGGLDGEYGHPDIVSLQGRSMLRRLAIIDPKLVSHCFRRVWCEKSHDGQTWVVLADVKPTGPYGKYLDEVFQDENHDTCFSLRTLTTEPVIKDGIGYKQVAMMVTYDYEPVPGFEAASKRYAIGMERFTPEFVSDSQERCLTVASAEELDKAEECLIGAGLESFSSDELLNTFKTNKIETSIVETKFGTFDTKTGVLTGDIRSSSLVNKVLKGVL